MVDLPGDTRENSHPPDYPLRPGDEDSPPESPQHSSVRTSIVAIVLLIAAAAAWVVLVRGPGSPLQPVSESTPAESGGQDRALPLGGAAAAVSVPPLDQSDALVRDLVRRLTTQPSVAAWLATDGLIRNFTVSIANVADGITPERHLRRLRPSEPFAVVRQGDELVIDPASYHRYDTFAAAAASIDPARISGGS